MAKSLRLILPGFMAMSSALACSGPVNNDTDYAVRNSAFLVPDVDTEASTEVPDGCSRVPEPNLIVADLLVENGTVVISVANTISDSVKGTIELQAATSSGTKSNLMPFALAGLDTTTVTVPLEATGVDDTTDLSILTGSIRATLEDGTTTFASASTVYDVRSTKPEEMDPAVAGDKLERPAVAFVRDGVDEERLRSEDRGTVEKVLVQNKYLCFDVTMNFDSGNIGEDTSEFVNARETAIFRIL